MEKNYSFEWEVKYDERNNPETPKVNKRKKNHKTDL